MNYIDYQSEDEKSLTLQRAKAIRALMNTDSFLLVAVKDFKIEIVGAIPKEDILINEVANVFVDFAKESDILNRVKNN